MGTPHIGDVGTILRATIVEEDDDNPGTFDPVDVSGVTEQELIIHKQDGTVVTETTVFTTDGTDGQIQYRVDDPDFFNVGGQWKMQGHVIFPTGTPKDEYKSNIVTFHVEENIQ